jgi:hypothetical protein
MVHVAAIFFKKSYVLRYVSRSGFLRTFLYRSWEINALIMSISRPVVELMAINTITAKIPKIRFWGLMTKEILEYF